MPQHEKLEEATESIAPKVAALAGVKDAATALAKAKVVSAAVSERAGELAKEASKEVQSMVRKHPFQALLAGFGLGCLVGIFAARKVA